MFAKQPQKRAGEGESYKGEIETKEFFRGRKSSKETGLLLSRLHLERLQKGRPRAVPFGGGGENL